LVAIQWQSGKQVCVWPADKCKRSSSHRSSKRWIELPAGFDTRDLKDAKALLGELGA